MLTKYLYAAVYRYLLNITFFTVENMKQVMQVDGSYMEIYIMYYMYYMYEYLYIIYVHIYALTKLSEKSLTSYLFSFFTFFTFYLLQLSFNNSSLTYWWPFISPEDI